jgi:hypothetical protein
MSIRLYLIVIVTGEDILLAERWDDNGSSRTANGMNSLPL